MNALNELFTEYVRMRQNGLESREALQHLRPYIEPLDNKSKQHLAAMMRQWEHGGEAPTAPASEAQPPPRSSIIKPLNGPPPGARRGEMPDVEWIACPNCGKMNRREDVFCYQCGQILEEDDSQFATQTFAATDDLYRDDYFGPDSILVMEVRHIDRYFELRPQTTDHEIVIGRSTGNSAMVPDIDLAEFGAEDLGVSRLHLALKYDGESEAIQIHDLGSSNGTFLNGQRLNPKELRVLRHNDEVRLGRFVIRVYFSHPGQE
ncbi:MAG: FHA domain-containing protein [Chloroflexi bacterium]|nr:MAG: FHA domain-containing protein [Chloroflexota bacterium]